MTPDQRLQRNRKTLGGIGTSGSVGAYAGRPALDLMGAVTRSQPPAGSSRVR